MLLAYSFRYTSIVTVMFMLSVQILCLLLEKMYLPNELKKLLSLRKFCLFPSGLIQNSVCLYLAHLTALYPQLLS